MTHSFMRYGALSAALVYGVLAVALVTTATRAFAAPSPDEYEPVRIAPIVFAGDHGRHGHQAIHPPLDKPGPDCAGKHAERHGEPRGPSLPGLHLAARLAAAETYVGITADQEDAWRAYTSALISFFERPMPMHARLRPGHAPETDGRHAPQPSAQAQRPEGVEPPPLLVEMLAEHAIEQGEKAQALLDAVRVLRSTLDDEQIFRLVKAERAFAPPPGLPAAVHGRHRGPASSHHGHHQGGPRHLPHPPAGA